MEKHAGTRSLSIINSADKLAGRPIWLCIGNNDERVDTDKAIAFTRKVVAEAVIDLTGDVWRVRATDSTLGAAPTACLLSVIGEIGFGGPLAAPATLELPIKIGADVESARRP